MTDWKSVRESIGFTQALQSKDAKKWHSLAQGHHAAARILEERRDQIPHDTRPFAFNAALSLELILKSVLARKLINIPSGANGSILCPVMEANGASSLAQAVAPCSRSPTEVWFTIGPLFVG
jgi:hypothetical protein